MKVKPEQLESIRKIIDESNITIETLRDDLLDHLCCAVEIKMSRGKEFERALKEALDELAPNGLDELQHETIFLLNSTKIILMKKIMYAIGLISAMSFGAGWFFGMLHLPGARELSIYGFFAFAFIFLPMLTINYFKLRIQRALSEKLKIVLGLLSGILIGLSLVFKTLHLQGAQEILQIGAFIFIFGFLPFLFFNMYKKSIA